MNPWSSNWGFDFISAEIQTTVKSSVIAGLPLFYFSPHFFLRMLNGNAKWFVSAKSSACCFSPVWQQKEAVSQRCRWGGSGGRSRFIFVFQEEVNNKYSLTCQQHNICSVTLRWRTEAEPFKKKDRKKHQHQSSRPWKGNMRLYCISWVTKCRCFVLFCFVFLDYSNQTQWP